MATYNGAQFLEEQIESILSQSYSDWRLFIRDDQSKDNTRAIIGEYASKYPDKIIFVEDDLNLGATQNFSELMKQGDAPYIMFSDQDDVWLPKKVEVSLQRIQALEQQHGQIPLYVFSDLEMIDGKGQVFAESLWKHDKINPNYTSLNRLLVQNVPYGCATIINRPLLDIGFPVPEKALLHDHWLVLLAAALGHVDYIREATIQHRIHGRNTSRQKSASDVSIIKKIDQSNFRTYFTLLESQGQAVIERLSGLKGGEDAIKVVQEFVSLRKKNFFSRKKTMIFGRYFKHSMIKTLKWIIRI